MSDFAKMDVFFIVATVAVVIVTALIAVAIIYVLRIIRNVEKISRIVSEEGELLRGDIADLRSSVRIEGFKLRHLAKLWSVVGGRSESRRKKKSDTV